MTTTAANKVFVDTNILVYAHLALSPLYTAALTRLQDLNNAGFELWISRQTLREYLSAMTRPGVLTGSIPIPSLLADVRNLASRFAIAEDGPAVTTHLLTLMSTFPAGGKQVHDTNIVATMLAHNILQLLTHNTSDFARFASVITVMPLVP
jgi:predicted nucleic acid-binding protein